MAIGIKPVHQTFQTVGSDADHAVFHTFYESNEKAHQTFQTVGSNADHTSFVISGFQYFFSASEQMDGEALVSVYEDWQIEVTIAMDEYIDSTDDLFDGSGNHIETVPVHEDWAFEITQHIDEFASPILDTTPVYPDIRETVPIYEDWSFEVTQHIDELVSSSDETSDLFIPHDVTDTLKVEIANAHIVSDTLKVEISGKHDVTDSVNIGVFKSDLTGVTNASGTSTTVPNNPIIININDPTPTTIPIPGDVTTITNPNTFEPTVILGGSPVVYNSSTAPSAFDSNTYYIEWLDAALPNNNLCDVTDFSLSLGFNGGSFSITTQNKLGELDDSINIFGLTGSVTREGKQLGTTSHGYTTRGIFGSPVLHKEFNLITNSNINYIQYLDNQIMYPLLINDNQAMTVWDMARNIAHTANVTIGFYVVDSPYTDPLAQIGQTGLSALGSLASQVGGQLRWNGTDSYQITYPDHFAGNFTVADKFLLTAEGNGYENIKNLELGLSGTGVLNITRPPTFETETSEIPGNSATEVIEPMFHLVNALPDNAPPLKLALPDDTKSVKIQILLDSATDVSGVSGPGAGFVTANDSIWFDLGEPSISNKYVQITDTFGGFGKKVALIYPELFPDIPAINNGEFQMNIGVVKQDRTPQFQASQDNSRNELKDLINKMNANIRYLKTYEGTISCYFHGTLPLPGMWASATLCGDTVEGIIESVNFSHPGVLTIGVAQYLRVNFLQPGINIGNQPIDQVY